MRERMLVWVVLVALLLSVAAPLALAQGDDGGGQDEISGEELAPLIFAPLAALGAMAAFWLVYVVFVAAMMLIALASLAVTVLAVWDCVHRDFPDRNTQALWCILILFTRWLGAIVYYFAVYRPDTPPRAA